MVRFNIVEWEKSPWWWVGWLAFALVWMTFDIIVGQLFIAGMMLGLAVHYLTKLIDTVVERREEKLKALKEEETNGI